MLKIIAPGMQTTVQDAGRRGYQQYGVPVAGAMDKYAFAMANRLVGNTPDAPAIEALLMPPSIQFEKASVFAVTGAKTIVMLSGKVMPMWRSIVAQSGDVLTFQSAHEGCRVYIAFAGGIDIEPVMGSTSTYLKGKIGGFGGRTLMKDDILKVGAVSDLFARQHYYLPQRWIPNYEKSLKLRVVLGPQQSAFTDQGIQTLLNSPYKVSTDSDRMGYRLEGAAIETVSGSDMISDGIVMGAIQVPGNGQPIVMMADRQTTGGYAKIACIITPDLSKIAQALPGTIIYFNAITLEEAHIIYKKEKADFVEICKAIHLQTAHQTKCYKITVEGINFDVTVDDITF